MAPTVGNIAAVGTAGPVTAVLIDRWPLVRLGLVGVLAGEAIEVVGQSAKAAEGLLLARRHYADLVVIGSPIEGLRPETIRGAKQEADPPLVMVLVSPAHATDAEIALLFAAGADALLEACAGPEELADAVARVCRGERVVGRGLGGISGGAAVESEQTEPASMEGPSLLTAKEMEVLACLTEGQATKQIARAMYVSEATIKTHLQHIYAKLEVQNRFGALARAAELGLLRGSSFHLR